jgi:hypothetical protein
MSEFASRTQRQGASDWTSKNRYPDTASTRATLEGSNPMSIKQQEREIGGCQATTRAGRRCAAPPVRGHSYCALHSDRNRAAELGRKGGAGNRKVYAGDADKISVPESAGDVKRMLAEAMADIRASRIDPKLG